MVELFHRSKHIGSPIVYKPDRWEAIFPGLEIGMSSRIGGKSAEHYGSLNCGLHVGDVPEDVIENRRRLASATSLPFEAWTYAEQVHGTQIAVITHEQKGMGRDSRTTALQDTDGMITNESGISLALQFADCVPIYFIAPDQRAIGLAHAGWKGTVQQITTATIDRMIRTYGCQSERIMSIIGPSIRSCCYEVDRKVIDQVDALISELGITIPVYTHKNQDHFMLDLQQLNRQIMIKAGILPSHIEITNLCTACNTDQFFSHRAEHGKTGRMAAWISMVDP